MARGSYQGYNKAAKQDAFLGLVRKGWSDSAARDKVGVSENTPLNWKKDPAFLARYEDARAEYEVKVALEGNVGYDYELPGFKDFCFEYLNGYVLAPHQEIWDIVIEGGDPTEHPFWHPSMTFKKGDPSRVLILAATGVGKSMFLDAKMCYWFLEDQSANSLIFSATEYMAKRHIREIRKFLTDKNYKKLQDTFGPPGGWKSATSTWTQTEINVGRENDIADGGHNTFRALGINSTFWGARATHVLIDDAENNENVKDWPEHLELINDTIVTRLVGDDHIVVIGNVLDSVDVYSSLLDRNNYPDLAEDEEIPWTVCIMPMMLDEGDGKDPATMKTLAPKSHVPFKKGDLPDEDGLYEWWSPERVLRLKSGFTNPFTWDRKYQQIHAGSDTVFKSGSLLASCQARDYGVLPNDATTGREGGMRDLTLIGGIDLALGGWTVLTVLALDRKTGCRYVLDIDRFTTKNGEEIFNHFKVMTERWHSQGLREWRIEGNAFQTYFITAKETKAYAAKLGVKLTNHHTGKNKFDDDMGVANMSSLFDNELLKLPSRSNMNVKALIQELLVWTPDRKVGNKKIKSDLVMSLWVAEYGFQLLMNSKRNRNFNSEIFARGGVFSRR